MWKNLPLKSCVYASGALSALSIVAVIGLRSYLPPVVPLFYGLPSGVNQLVPTLGLLIVPITSLAITTLNIFLTKFTKDLFFKMTLIVASTFISVLTAITIFKIILLVGFF